MSKGNGNNATTVSLCVQGLLVPCWPGFPSLSVSNTLQGRPLSVGKQQPAVGRDGWLYIDVKYQSVNSDWVIYTGWTVRLKWSSLDIKVEILSCLLQKHVLRTFLGHIQFCWCCIKGKSNVNLNLHFAVSVILKVKLLSTTLNEEYQLFTAWKAVPIFILFYIDTEIMFLNCIIRWI